MKTIYESYILEHILGDIGITNTIKGATDIAHFMTYEDFEVLGEAAASNFGWDPDDATEMKYAQPLIDQYGEKLTKTMLDWISGCWFAVDHMTLYAVLLKLSKNPAKLSRILGSGSYGVVFDIGDNKVCKLLNPMEKENPADETFYKFCKSSKRTVNFPKVYRYVPNKYVVMERLDIDTPLKNKYYKIIFHQTIRCPQDCIIYGGAEEVKKIPKNSLVTIGLFTVDYVTAKDDVKIIWDLLNDDQKKAIQWAIDVQDTIIDAGIWGPKSHLNARSCTFYSDLCNPNNIGQRPGTKEIVAFDI